MATRCCSVKSGVDATKTDDLHDARDLLEIPKGGLRLRQNIDRACFRGFLALRDVQPGAQEPGMDEFASSQG